MDKLKLEKLFDAQQILAKYSKPSTQAKIFDIFITAFILWGR